MISLIYFVFLMPPLTFNIFYFYIDFCLLSIGLCYLILLGWMFSIYWIGYLDYKRFILYLSSYTLFLLSFLLKSTILLFNNSFIGTSAKESTVYTISLSVICTLFNTIKWLRFIVLVWIFLTKLYKLIYVRNITFEFLIKWEIDKYLNWEMFFANNKVNSFK